MSKGNQVLQVRISEDMVFEIECLLDDRNKRTQEEIWTVSDWVRHAIEEKIAHTLRGRKTTRVPKYRCCQCNRWVGLAGVSHFLRPLFGPTEYTCVSCVEVGIPQE